MITVLAHGCFDVLHPGHIRHLQLAKDMGDHLTVSITADEFVDKGPGRPHFTAEQRANAIKALACVDEVAINESPNAVDMIKRVRPNIYVKGIDYYNSTDLVLAEEQAAVEAVGGKITFTNSEKFSSSRLINAEKFDTATLHYLTRCRELGFQDQIFEAFAAADSLKITFVGEMIADEYRYVQGLGRPSKEWMLAGYETGRERFNGGIIASHLHGEFAQCEYQTAGCEIIKTRLVDKDFNRKLFDLYSAKSIVLTPETREKFRQRLRNCVATQDVVIVNDFGHGLIENEECRILEQAKFLAVNAQTNAGNYGFNPVTKYLQADLVVVDEPEARLATGMAEQSVEKVIDQLVELIDCDRFIVTRGKYGSSFRDCGTLRMAGDNFSSGEAPAFILGGVDTLGAGDAALATTAPLIAAGLSVEAAAFVGNVAGAIKTTIIGHRRHITRNELVRTVEAMLA